MALAAYNCMQCITISDNIKSLVSAANFLALLGQPNHNDTEIYLAKIAVSDAADAADSETATYYAAHWAYNADTNYSLGSFIYAAAQSAFYSAAASNADGYYTAATSAAAAVIAAKDTADLKSAFTCAAGIIYLDVYTILTRSNAIPTTTTIHTTTTIPVTTIITDSDGLRCSPVGIIINETNTIFSTTELGATTYIDNAHCIWYIQAPEGLYPMISFTQFDTEVYWDYFYIYNGHGMTDLYPSFPRSGNMGILDITGSTSSITLEFTSDFSLHFPGVVGTVIFVQPTTTTTTTTNILNPSQ